MNNHTNEEEDRKASLIRSESGQCLYRIQIYGDESTQSELVSSEYAVISVLQVSTAGGDGEQEDFGIFSGLYNISEFLKSLYQGRQTDNINPGPPFPQQISLARRSNEQIEEEGGNEEIEAQLINKGEIFGQIKQTAKNSKCQLLNYFIDQRNPRPNWYEDDQDNEDQDNEDQDNEDLNNENLNEEEQNQ
ncbi:MAG: hypothetical protein EZS28_017494 [Streblomastix strix]|uniref:Uncharacterized protein n=1 Tax=Streblomastix strix TaxID=222440 RepID=A0A5J4VXG6_9EUKA|nr:MAG: hypothetical protein EZS28_017494 [Streblomastix strix]